MDAAPTALVMVGDRAAAACEGDFCEVHSSALS
jgi:hypothetical protein